MMSDTIVPDFIIFDELKRERERRERRNERPRLEIPRYMPWPEERDAIPMASERDEEAPERGEVIIPMW